MVFLLRVCLVALSGLFVFASYEPLGLWFLGIIGMSLFIVAFSPIREHTVSLRVGGFLGWLHALVVYLLLLPWVGVFVGKMPYLALALFLSLWSILLGIVGARLWLHRYGMWAFSLVYLVVEVLRSSVPFGGFAWVRLSWGQISGPLAPLAAWGGPALVTVMTVFIATLVAYAIIQRQLTKQLAIGISVVAIAVLGAISAPVAAPVATVTVAAIQGNVPRLGLDFNAQRRAVLDNHVQQTLKLTEPVDLVIWPENSSDVNPFTDTQAAQGIQTAVSHVQAPVLVGTITTDEVGPRNTMQVFDPVAGVGDYHYKKFLQPFGEYMPLRSFFRLFSELVDKAGNFQPGTGTGTVTMHAAQISQDVIVGIATCYEVAFDEAFRSSVRHGAQILTTPTNNATFGFTDMTYQQLAMSRMRALEYDRAVVVAATSGVSAIVLPDGSVQQRTDIFQADTLVAQLPIKDSVTFAARYGEYVQWLCVALGVLAAAGALLFPRHLIQHTRARKK